LPSKAGVVLGVTIGAVGIISLGMNPLVGMAFGAVYSWVILQGRVVVASSTAETAS